MDVIIMDIHKNFHFFSLFTTNMMKIKVLRLKDQGV
jgi:hypothetical protein